MTYTVKGAEATERLGWELAKQLTEQGRRRAFIAMRGEMGVGKTVFTRGFASYFGIVGVKSPTYTIVNEYRKGDVRIYHFDLYRIEDSDDLASIGYDDYVVSDGYCIAEWSERVPEEIPEDSIFVTIGRCDEDEEERRIEISEL